VIWRTHKEKALASRFLGGILVTVGGRSEESSERTSYDLLEAEMVGKSRHDLITEDGELDGGLSCADFTYPRTMCSCDLCEGVSKVGCVSKHITPHPP
jgi:hypothetical protein